MDAITHALVGATCYGWRGALFAVLPDAPMVAADAIQWTRGEWRMTHPPRSVRRLLALHRVCHSALACIATLLGGGALMMYAAHVVGDWLVHDVSLPLAPLPVAVRGPLRWGPRAALVAWCALGLVAFQGGMFR